MKQYNTHKIIRRFCLTICLLLMIGLAATYVFAREEAVFAVDKVESVDKGLDIKWKLRNPLLYQGVCLEICQDERIVFSKELPVKGEIKYTEGEHGKKYVVKLLAKKRKGELTEESRHDILFLDFDMLPKMPLMVVNTYSGEDPTYEDAIKPDEDYWGETQVNNESIPGQLDILKTNQGGTFEKIKIATRGNTSTVYYDKKAYKIELEEPADLLGLGDGVKTKEWILLNNANNLKTFFGHEIAKLTGMEWQHSLGFVNLFLNGDWKGCYYLTPAVSFEYAYNKGLVSEKGYIFENDIYWWAEDGPYFRTNSQMPQLAYTFKYPKVKSERDARLLHIKNYMQEFEDKLLFEDKSYKEYLDENSLVTWIIARDILGNGDEGGTNMFFYKYDYIENTPTSTKVKIGPLWDFDGVFMVEEDWSSCRAEYVFWYDKLFLDKEFSDKYKEKWNSIESEIIPFIEESLEVLNWESQGEIDKSWELESERWGYEIPSLSRQSKEGLDTFLKQVEWISNNV